MLPFIINYGSNFLFILNLILWILYYQKNEFTEVNRYAIKLFIVFLAYFSVWNISTMLLKEYSFFLARVVWLAGWVGISIFELYYVISVLFKLAKARGEYSDMFLIIIAILAIPITLAAVLSYTNKTYNPINTTDFYNIILLMFGSILIMRGFIHYDTFIDNIESFFIFFGFIMYFGLHILASNAISINFISNWNFGQYATLLSLIYWLGSILVVWKIRSKHS